MSFVDLKSADYSRRKKEFTVKDYTFTAHELSFFQKVEIEGLRTSGEDWLTKYVSYSVTDSTGAKMTQKQASELPPELADLFLKAVMEVNAPEPEQNKKK